MKIVSGVRVSLIRDGGIVPPRSRPMPLRVACGQPWPWLRALLVGGDRGERRVGGAECPWAALGGRPRGW